MGRKVERGEVWTAAGGPDYAGKPRPVVIVQGDRFPDTQSVTVCLLTTDSTDVPLVRPLIQPSADNGLRAPCRLMVDKLSTIPKAHLGKRIGRLEPASLSELNLSIFLFLGLG